MRYIENKMDFNEKYHMKKNCENCNKIFYVRKKNGRLSKGVRPFRSSCCSKKCSRELRYYLGHKKKEFKVNIPKEVQGKERKVLYQRLWRQLPEIRKSLREYRRRDDIKLKRKEWQRKYRLKCKELNVYSLKGVSKK